MSNLNPGGESDDTDVREKCELCRKILNTKVTVSAHMKTIHGNTARPRCDQCRKTFSSPRHLRRHRDILHSTVERVRVPCTFPDCDKSYMTNRILLQHVKSSHVDNPARFGCTLCRKEFVSKGHLHDHIAIHTTEKTYKCPTCKKSFAQRGALKVHEQIHTNKSIRSKCPCNLCPKTFLCKGDLQKHIRVGHENQRNFVCAFCVARFSTAGNMKRHIEARHDSNKKLTNFSCENCEYKSHSKSNLAQHMRRHTAIKQGCYFCRKKFLSFPELVKHLGRIHTLEKNKEFC